MLSVAILCMMSNTVVCHKISSVCTSILKYTRYEGGLFIVLQKAVFKKQYVLSFDSQRVCEHVSNRADLQWTSDDTRRSC